MISFWYARQFGTEDGPAGFDDGNDEAEPLRSEIDLGEILVEALSLGLPDYPRADGAALEQAVFTEPGLTPMTDQDTKPFASLAALKDKLKE